MAINPQTGMDVDYTVRATVCPKYQGSWLCNLVCIYRKILVNSRLLLMKLLIKLWSAMPVLWNFMNSASVSQSVKCEDTVGYDHSARSDSTEPIELS